MKSAKNLYPEISSFGNLLSAAKKARRGKRKRPDVLQFHFDLEPRLLELHDQLTHKSYRPGKYRNFTIYDPKQRTISAPPYRDRIVHHALCNVIEPIFDKTWIYHTYACRKNKGTHEAVRCLHNFARAGGYVLRCDIRRYFPSVDIGILYEMIRRKISCPDTLWLIKLILYSGPRNDDALEYFPGDDLFTPVERRKGLPIGTQISQLCSTIYLTPLDRFVKQQLKIKRYLRYCDDFCLLAQEKKELDKARRAIRSFLQKLRLRLNEKKCQIFPVKQGIKWLGYKVFPEKILLLRDNYKREKNRLRRHQKLYAADLITFEEIQHSYISWLGHAQFARSRPLCRRLLQDFVLKPGGVSDE